MSRLLESTGAIVHLPPGCHPAIEEEIVLRPGAPLPVPAGAADFVLHRFPGVVEHHSPLPETAPEPAPETPADPRPSEED